MTKYLVILLGISAIAFSACGKHAQQAANNPQVQQDEKQAQAIVQGCLPKGNLVTPKGRKAILTCIAPPGHEAAFQKCAGRALGKGVVTSAQRQRFYQALVICVEKNR